MSEQRCTWCPTCVSFRHNTSPCDYVQLIHFFQIIASADVSVPLLVLLRYKEQLLSRVTEQRRDSAREFKWGEWSSEQRQPNQSFLFKNGHSMKLDPDLNTGPLWCLSIFDPTILPQSIPLFSTKPHPCLIVKHNHCKHMHIVRHDSNASNTSNNNSTKGKNSISLSKEE